MRAADTVKLTSLVFVAALVQVTVFAAVDVAGGSPNLLLVVLVAVALLRGSVVGAGAGFLGGLIADVATLETLGLTSLVLTVAGYWVGRYGETTGRERPYAPLLAVLVTTVLLLVGTFSVHFLLGEDVSARRAIVEGMLPAVLFNVLLAAPVYVLARRLLGAHDGGAQPREVSVLG